jgi:hypothetical protein
LWAEDACRGSWHEELSDSCVYTEEEAEDVLPTSTDEDDGDDDDDRFTGEEWRNIPDTILINLVKSMPRQCHFVIEGNGEQVDY